MTNNFRNVIIDKLHSQKYNVNMIYKTFELKQKVGGYQNLNAALEKGDYFKIAHGLYSDKAPFNSDLENIFAIYPSAILTLESAFAYYEMSDYIPSQYIVATKQNAHKIKSNKVKQIFITNSLLDIGKEIVTTKEGTINIYNLERLLIELFRMKTKLSYSYFKEIVNAYRDLFNNDQIDVNKLMSYCNLFKHGENIKKQIQDIIL